MTREQQELVDSCLADLPSAIRSELRARVANSADVVHDLTAAVRELTAEQKQLRLRIDSYFAGEAAKLAREERQLHRATAAVQCLYGIPCAALIIGGFWLAAYASGLRESWGTSGLCLLGLVLLVVGAVLASGAWHAATHERGFYRGLARWRESIKSRRALLEHEKSQALRELSTPPTPDAFAI